MEGDLMISWLLPLIIWSTVGLYNIWCKDKISKCDFILCWIALILALINCIIQ